MKHYALALFYSRDTSGVGTGGVGGLGPPTFQTGGAWGAQPILQTNIIEQKIVIEK